MASTTPTAAPFRRKAKLVWLAVIDPQRFEEEEKADADILNSQTDRQQVPRVRKIRAALWESFIWCSCALAAGVLLGLIAWAIIGASMRLAISLIIAGTLVVLWATLSQQGWEIQSYGGVSLGERLNRWIFRSLYAFGTALMVAGSIWSLVPLDA